MSKRSQDFFKDNQELFKIILFALAVLLGILTVITIYYFAINQGQTSYVDPVSGETVNMMDTGAISDDGPTLIGVTKDKFEGMDLEAFTGARKALIKYFTYAFPQIKSLSYKKDSIHQENNQYYFTLVSDTKKNFDVSFSGTNQNDYIVTVYSNNKELYSYDASAIKESPHLPDELHKSYLPHELTIEDDIPVNVLWDNLRKVYIISLNNCGRESLKTAALDAVNQWLTELNFNPEDFEFEIPEYCDGNS